MSFFSTLNAFFVVVALLVCSSECRKLPNPKIIEDSTYLNVPEDRQGNINKIPTSCSDLLSVGRAENGLHLFKAPDGIKITFCDFSKNPGTTGYETAIGYADVKTKPVIFQACLKKTIYSSKTNFKKNIIYEETKLNIGGGYDNTTGFFKAPVTGTYFFSTGTWVVPTTEDQGAGIELMKEKTMIGSNDCRNPRNRFCHFTFQHTVFLNAGEKVNVVANVYDGLIENGSGCNTNFNGWLLSEDQSSLLATI